MKISPLHSVAPLAFALALALAPDTTRAAGFVYEGRLDDLGQPANGRYDLRLSVYPDAVHGAMLAGPIVFEDVDVVDGRFRVDFELPLVGASPAWIAVGVREGAAVGTFSTIPGRSEAVSAKLIGACWSSTGDSATNPAVNFIGTTDAQPFVVRTQNAQSLRIEPSTILFNGAPITSNTIAGSSANSVSAGVRGATIAGGGVPAGESDPDLFDEAPNRITDHYGVVGGGYNNQAGDAAGTLADSAFATVGGGDRNTASGDGSTVGGGDRNTASGQRSTVGGGFFNSSSEFASTVGGGSSNRASNSGSTVGGGNSNSASGSGSTVGGGSGNTASGLRSTVGGGNQNCAGGDYSWAGGRQARTRPGNEPGDGTCTTNSGDADGDNGTFVWADDQGSFFISTGPRQFLVRADGGFGFNTNTIPAGIEAVFQSRSSANANVDLYLRTGDHGRGINLAMLPTAGAAQFRLAQYDGVTFTDRLSIFSNGDFQVTAQAFKPGGGAWAVPSDARLKTEVAPLVGTLERLLALRGVSFAYREDATPKAMYLPGRQDGFIAQEVEAVFPEWVSETDEGYKTVGPRGFEALTVEALRELRAESATIDAGQSARMAALEADNAALRARLERLEALLGTRSGEAQR